MTTKIDTWQKIAKAELHGRAIEDLNWTTLEGITIKPLYTEDDLEGVVIVYMIHYFIIK
ncbi:MAG: hypothetical protein GDA36_07995 [Rhodobacteraceae bacterium]|nr:hypothetical protein [Paracoccaceae bacterium]